MKPSSRILSFLSCAALLLAIAPKAHATAISGDLSMIGQDSFTSSSITFQNPAYIFGGSGANTGSFSVLPDMTPVTMFPLLGGGPLPYSTGFNVVPAAVSPVEVFTVSNGTVSFQFWMTDYTATYLVNQTGCTAATCIDVTGDGFFTGTGYASTPGSFTFTSQETNGQTSTTFSASAIAATPEPESLAMVGTGLVGLFGFARRKFAL